MQGTVFAPLKCTTQIDKLGKLAYRSGKSLLTYKNTVKIPPLGMVDDILSVTQCGIECVKSNAIINSFVESKKLEFADGKCHQIHVGKSKSRNICPELRIHENKMEKSDKEKYLGNIITKEGNNVADIEARKAKGHGIVSEIMAILNEVPLGKHYLDAGLCLRNAMLINGMLTNSEILYGLKNSQIEEIEEVDELLLRNLLNAPSKTPK